MKERYFHASLLAAIQTVAWYVFLAYFTIVTVLYMLRIPLANHLAAWGIILILIGTSIEIVVMAEQFRLARFYRYWLLCYTLILVLLGTVWLKVYFTV